MPTLGQPAPEFRLFHAKGEQLSLSDLRGRNAVLAFFPAAFTGVCTEEMCGFRDSLAAFEELDAAVVAISADGIFTTQKFAELNALGFPVLSDVHREAISAYGVAWDDFGGVPGYTVANRAVFVVDKDGVLRWQWVAANPGVMPDFEAVKGALAEL